MDGANRATPAYYDTPYYGYYLPDIYFVNGWWYGFKLERYRPGGINSDRYDVWLWDSHSYIWTRVYVFTGTTITSARGVLGAERNSLSDPPASPYTYYGTFYRTQYRDRNGPDTYYPWPGAKHAPYPPWQRNDQGYGMNFYLTGMGTYENWIYVCCRQ